MPWAILCAAANARWTVGRELDSLGDVQPVYAVILVFGVSEANVEKATH